MTRNNRKNKGFTLIELLVVIAIIAILATVVILSLNPAELLRQSRDSNRVSDAATLKSAISLYLADVSSPNLASSASPCNTYNCAFFSGMGAANPAGGALSTSGIQSVTLAATTTNAALRNVDATGWLPVGFNKISSGAPIGTLPVDPVNATSSVSSCGGGQLIYGYVATSTGTLFKITMHTESTKFSYSGCAGGGSGDVEGPDGGISTTTYEQGTGLSL